MMMKSQGGAVLCSALTCSTTASWMVERPAQGGKQGVSGSMDEPAGGRGSRHNRTSPGGSPPPDSMNPKTLSH